MMNEILMIMMISVHNWKTNSLSEDTYEIGTIDAESKFIHFIIYRNYFVKK